MAQDASNDIIYFLLIDESQREDLVNIRTWSNLKVAVEGKNIWVKNFNFAQIHSLEVKAIPFKALYYSHKEKLYPLGSLLPERNIPGLLWSPIERVLQVVLPSYNHNYFGLKENIEIKLIETEEECSAEAMITKISVLKKYMETAAEVRLGKLKWTILNNDKVLIMGTPLLPIDGKVFWIRGQSFIPAGYDFELHLLHNEINALVDPEMDSYIVWNEEGTFALVEKDKLESLSIGSFRNSLIKLPLHS